MACNFHDMSSEDETDIECTDTEKGLLDFMLEMECLDNLI